MELKMEQIIGLLKIRNFFFLIFDEFLKIIILIILKMGNKVFFQKINVIINLIKKKKIVGVKKDTSILREVFKFLYTIVKL